MQKMTSKTIGQKAESFINIDDIQGRDELRWLNNIQGRNELKMGI